MSVPRMVIGSTKLLPEMDTAIENIEVNPLANPELTPNGNIQNRNRQSK